MNTEPYAFAHLRQEEIQQIRQLEQQLAQSTGHPITLIAFEEEPPAQEQ
ncbi:hypothetical protein [Cohnella sp. AR92]|nr:hypothetical protein [Cohnella sp. AR92]